MSSSNPPFFATQPPRVTLAVFTRVVWAGMAVSFLFVVFRAFARWKSFRRYFLDDLFVVFAWTLVLATAIMWHFVAAYLFQINNVASGQLPISQAPTLVPDTELYLRISVAVIIFFYTSLWAIKVSFLIFFRKITTGTYIRAQTIHWWIVFGFTLATWFACLGSLEYNCFAAPLAEIAQHCSNKHSVRFQRVALIFNCAMDVITDIMITSIPISILWNVKINIRQKLALSGIFSLTVITMIFAVIRVAIVTRQTRTTLDTTWLYLWSAIEPPVAIIVACLASFRSLFTKQELKSRPARKGYVREGKTSSRWFFRNNKDHERSNEMGNLNGEPISKGSAEEEPKLAKNWSASDYVSPTEIV